MKTLYTYVLSFALYSLLQTSVLQAQVKTLGSTHIHPIKVTTTDSQKNRPLSEKSFAKALGCDTINNIVDGDQALSWLVPPNEGYIGGHNVTRNDYVSEKFEGSGPTNVMGATFYFANATQTTPDQIVRVKVWEEIFGQPDAEVYSQDVPLKTIVDRVASADPGKVLPIDIVFDAPAIVTTTDFFVGLQLIYASGGGDTVDCALTQNLNSNPTRPNSLWFGTINSPTSTTWTDAETVFSGVAQWSMHVYPWITDLAPEGIILSNSPICEGDILDLDASASTNTVDWNWKISGTATPNPLGSSPSVAMNQAGDYWAVTRAYNYCGIFVEDSILVTVNPLPDLAVTANESTICTDASTDLTATGATSYSWTPSTSLSCNNCPNPTATLSDSETYSVTGTLGICAALTDITIEVYDLPVASFTMGNDSICEGQSVNLDASSSLNATNYSWTLTGADLETANGLTQVVTYSNPGTYSIKLEAENTCSEVNNTIGTLVVTPASICFAGIDNDSDLSDISSYFNPLENSIYVNFGTQLDSEINIELLSISGQLIFRKSLDVAQEKSTLEIPIKNVDSAIYLLRVTTNNAQSVTKYFVK